MVQESIHIIKTYFISFQFLKKKEFFQLSNLLHLLNFYFFVILLITFL